MILKKRISVPVVHFQDEYNQIYLNQEAPVQSPAKKKLEEKKIEKEKQKERKYPDALKKKQNSSYLSKLRPRKVQQALPPKKILGKGKEKEIPKGGKGKAKSKPIVKAKAKPKPKPRIKAPARRFRPPIHPFVPAPVPMEIDEPEIETDASKRRKEGIDVIWSQLVKPEDYVVNLDHMKFSVQLISDEIPLEGIDSNELIQLLDDTNLTSEEFEKWKAYGEFGLLFAKKEDVSRNLLTVISYCETDPRTGKGVKNKLRFITKTLKENKESREGIIMMLAQHGNVCNVMKEVAVHLAYSMIVNTMKEYVENQSLKQLILQQLIVLRELIIEEMFIKAGNFMNTHPLVAYRNGLADHVGLEIIPDQHSALNPAEPKRIRLFNKFYSTERITKWIANAMTEKNRKIPYTTVVDWLKENSPIEDSYEFLGGCFDPESGFITLPTILYILQKLQIIH